MSGSAELDAIAPPRMTLIGSWRELPTPTELYVDDRVGDGHLIGATADGQELCALIGYAAGVLHTVTWTGPVAINWRDSYRSVVKSRIRAAIAERHARGRP